MKADFWNTQLIAGGPIILGILITAGGFIAVAAQGNIAGLEAASHGNRKSRSGSSLHEVVNVTLGRAIEA